MSFERFLMNDCLSETRPVPSQKFSTLAYRQHEQFDAWCHFTVALCDLKSIAPPQSGFRAASTFHQIGSLLLTSFELPSTSFTLTSEIVRGSRLDHWCVSAVTKGVVVSESTRGGLKTSAGDTVLHSYAVPFSGLIDGAEFTSVFLSRDDFWDIADELDRGSHEQVTGPMSHLVADFIISLQNKADTLTVADAVAVKEAFGHLLKAMVRKTPSAMEAAKAPISAVQFDRARNFIMKNLKSPNLTPETICAGVGIARRQLYYLFERHGGVSTFIRNRRLTACFEALTKGHGKSFVSAIAYEYGFTNVSNFNRRFRERYGFSPSEARSARSSGSVDLVSDNATFVDWLLSADTH